MYHKRWRRREARLTHLVMCIQLRLNSRETAVGCDPRANSFFRRPNRTCKPPHAVAIGDERPVVIYDGLEIYDGGDYKKNEERERERNN